MERPINDFDEDVFRLIGGDIAEENDESNYHDYNEELDLLTGQSPLRYFNPLKPILNRMNMKAIDSDDSDYFGETPAFI